jgi:hypothetical protein
MQLRHTAACRAPLVTSRHADVRSVPVWRALPYGLYPRNMSRFTFGKRRDPQVDPADTPEDPLVRQYRYLLRTAPVDALESAHAEAIPLLSGAHRESLLETVRSSMLVGDHLTTSAHAKIAHLVTDGERRAPGQLLIALPPEVLQDLAARVLESESSFGLLGGYAGWDGAEPQPSNDSKWADGGFDPKKGRWDARNDPRGGKGFAAGGGPDR